MLTSVAAGSMQPETFAMKLFETETCDILPKVPSALVEAITRSPRTSDAHRSLMQSVDAMHLLELGGELDETSPLPGNLTVAAWNLQRCLYPEQSADLLRQQAPDIVLVSEMDGGMARTHQRNTTKALADSLGMRYLFGLEFFEMGLGNEIERRLAADQHNECGWHGNALLCKAEPVDVALIRLDDHGHWFCSNEEPHSDRMHSQPRVGGRCAVAAILPTELGNICAVSTHLENQTSPEGRGLQMERMLAAVDAFAPDLPVIVGGDLNTHNLSKDRDPAAEPLFYSAERHGYSWKNNMIGSTTRRSSLSYSSRPKRQLDWFCARGVSDEGAEILAAVDESGKVLSDHDMILGKFDYQKSH